MVEPTVVGAMRSAAGACRVSRRGRGRRARDVCWAPRPLAQGPGRNRVPHSLGGKAVPPLRLKRLPLVGAIDSSYEPFQRVVSDAKQRVGAALDGDWPLGVLPEREARNSENGGLFLDPARVGDNGVGVQHQGEKTQVALRFEQSEAPRSPTRLLQPPAAPRVNGVDDRSALGDLFQGLQDRLEAVRAVDEPRPVQGDEHVVLDLELGWDVQTSRRRLVGPQGVDHRVAHEGDLVWCDSLVDEVLICDSGWSEQKLGEVISQYPVVLLRHGPVPAPQTRLEVSYRDADLGGG